MSKIRTVLIPALVLLLAGVYISVQLRNKAAKTHHLANEFASLTRVVTISPSATEIIFALDAGETVVGVDRFCDFPPEVHTLPKVGGLQDPDLERIVSLHPTLLILRGRNDDVEKLCRDRGIRLYHDPTNTLTDLFTAIREIGVLVDRNEAAQDLVLRMKREFEAIHRRVERRPPVPVLFVISRSIDQLAHIYTTGKQSFLNSLIEIAGGRNVFGDIETDYLEIRPEAILAADPQVIIDAMPGKILGDAERAIVLAQWTALEGVPAVRNGRIHVITDSYVTIPSPRLVKLAAELSELLHPEPGFEP